ncbi:MAG: PhoX family phosphatase [Tistlia sp.]|uniref:PhoX family phosphatase n=1 Tax=Tistlia sp. TaxID=3057121 RepID=UPI0034A3A932
MDPIRPGAEAAEYSCRAEAYEASEDVGSNASANPTIGDVVNARFGRRDVLRGMLGVAAVSALAGGAGLAPTFRQALAAGGSFGFTEIEHGVDETHHVAPGYRADVLIRWGDPVVEGAPAFDPLNQTAAAQAQQFGYNNDFLGFVPLPAGSDSSDHGLLCVNHEYTSEEVMFPGLGRQDKADFAGMTRELVDIELAAHGASIVEIRRQDGAWALVPDSSYNRRITGGTTEIAVAGPAAGHDRLKTSADPSGKLVIGTLNNCAGGITPWGTYLTAEENFNGYFWGEAAGHPEEAKLKRYGAPGGWYAWGKFHDRFDVSKEANEVNRFGWIVEIDPLDPTSRPKKRTALGRFKHEGGETVVAPGGQVVIYMGDDERFDYVYKFVTAGSFDPSDRAANRDLLDEGTLFVARFDEDGGGEWLPLVFGEGPLTPENGFHSQADVVIDARLAGDLLGATRMDRPEDVEPNPKTGKVYVMLTNNTKRAADQVDAANPRAESAFGHIIEIAEAGSDFTATRFAWEILVKCGDPAVAEVGAAWNPATSENGWFASPDNCAVDNRGRLWITTDQGSAWSKSGTADGVWALETEGALRGTGRMFYRVPIGAEMCGPCFTADDRNLFVAVQHVATDGTKDYPGFERDSTFEDPATRWPDFRDDMPPRPSVVVITKEDGGVIGS